MPYILPRTRLEIANGKGPQSPGELNYCFTMLIHEYMNKSALGVNYTAINDVIGALEGAKLEFYRRVVVPYEDAKIQMSGDVYAPELITSGVNDGRIVMKDEENE